MNNKYINVIITFSLLLLMQAEAYAQCRINIQQSGLRQQILARIANNPRIGEQLQAMRLQQTNAIGTHAYLFPVIGAPDYYQPAVHYITNYVDLNPVSNGNSSSVLDYNCGNRSYDVVSSSYDHTGIEISIGPFPWKMSFSGRAQIRAAEAGVIIDKAGGHIDWMCAMGVATNDGNYIVLMHTDSSLTYYFHMMATGVTTKNIGDVVREGEYLGRVGSSGNSTGPHLHFEVHDKLGNVIDPFQNGSCNSPSGVGSLWKNEEPYHNKTILALYTLAIPWTDAACAANGILDHSEAFFEKNHFDVGETVLFLATVRDATPSSTIEFKIRNPAGVQVQSAVRTTPAFFTPSFITQTESYFIGNPVQGTYTLECTYNGNKKIHLFTVGCSVPPPLTGTRPANSGVISGAEIISTEQVNSGTLNTEYQAETFIQLNPGFTAAAGSELRGRIHPCTVGDD